VAPQVNGLCICGWPLVIVLVQAHIGFVIFLFLPASGRAAAKVIGRWGRQHGPERGGRTVADLIEDNKNDGNSPIE
jgi:hypothetical protein